MPRYLLDTSMAIEVLRGRRPDLVEPFNRHVDELATSTVVASELFYGAARSAAPDRLRRQVEWMLGLLPVLDFDRAAAAHAADVRAELAAAGTPIGGYDVLIAGHARSRGLVVVTANTREFARVAGLRQTGWAS
ncbi:MAG TPA: type II toxin-antitoxin system VapC family toxin [Intrasporangiaceae bacterium]|nr:type II toxin-antitoxin system VapC family toxin [Intrasporangiaceae bacterium]